MKRRDFIKQAWQTTFSVISTATIFILTARLLRQNPAPLRLSTEPKVLRPPGALPEKDFLSRCIRCQRCQDACRIGAIRLAGPGDGVALGTPFISATSTACNLCLDCGPACPTEALLTISNITDVKMGVAVIDKRTCVSHNETGVCGACHTACPLKNKAITQGPHLAPTVYEEHCVGCGLCEEACIVKGIKAIRVFSQRLAA